MAVTIREVARRAGVSISTVSRALSGQQRVRAENLRKVQQIVDQIEFCPSAVAKSLVSHTANAICLVLPKPTAKWVSNPFFMELIRGIVTRANQSNYDIIISSGSNEQEELKEVSRLFRGGRNMAKATEYSLRNQVVYSIYVRNHSEEGTFKAVEKDLRRIHDLGVDIIWLLPIHPIGQISRKGKLGSPYANQNYREVNPELGTREDFESLVKAIHSYGMKCIIDVVYNHTSPDSWLVKHHPEYFYKTPEGKLGNRVGDWGDIVDLDYQQVELWDYQIETLKMWASIVDGFRCDVAPLLPLDFWLRAREEVAKVNPHCIWLSESIEPEFIMHLRSRGMTALSDAEILQAFDACYDYDVYPEFSGYLTGDNPLSSYVDKINRQEYIYPDNYVKLRFLENHDRPRASKLIPNENELINWTVFMYFQKGMPLIYGGQEMQNDVCPGSLRSYMR